MAGSRVATSSWNDTTALPPCCAMALPNVRTASTARARPTPVRASQEARGGTAPVSLLVWVYIVAYLSRLGAPVAGTRAPHCCGARGVRLGVPDPGVQGRVYEVGQQVADHHEEGGDDDATHD